MTTGEKTAHIGQSVCKLRFGRMTIPPCYLLIKNASQFGTQKGGITAAPSIGAEIPDDANGRSQRPLGVSSPCLPCFRRAGPVKARPVRRLVGSVGACVSKYPALTGTASAEYPPRRGMTHPYHCSISIADNRLFSLCYLAGRRTLPRPCCLGAVSLSIAPPICLLISWILVNACRAS